MLSLVMVTIVSRPNQGCVASVAMVILPGDGDLLSSSVESETLGIVMSNEMKHYVQVITMIHFNIRQHPHFREESPWISFKLKQNLHFPLAQVNWRLPLGHQSQNILIPLCKYTLSTGNLEEITQRRKTKINPLTLSPGARREFHILFFVPSLKTVFILCSLSEHGHKSYTSYSILIVWCLQKKRI